MKSILFPTSFSGLFPLSWRGAVDRSHEEGRSPRPEEVLCPEFGSTIYPALSQNKKKNSVSVQWSKEYTSQWWRYSKHYAKFAQHLPYLRVEEGNNILLAFFCLWCEAYVYKFGKISNGVRIQWGITRVTLFTHLRAMLSKFEMLKIFNILKSIWNIISLL